MQLEMNSMLEEKIFYPAVRQEDDTEDLMNEAEEEHHVVDLLIGELRGMSASDPHFSAKFQVMAESVKHHIDEEETEMFPKAAELGQERLRQIGDQMEMQ